jgi:hypothetical protein
MHYFPFNIIHVHLFPSCPSLSKTVYTAANLKASRGDEVAGSKLLAAEEARVSKGRKQF